MNFLNLIKGIYKNPQINVIFSGERWKTFPLRLETRHLLPLLFSFVLEGLSGVNRQEKNKKHSIWKGGSKSVFIGDMILYIENPRESTKKQKTTIRINKLAGSKVNIQNSTLFLYINNMKNECKKLHL